MKRCSLSLIIKEKQRKTMGYHLSHSLGWLLSKPRERQVSAGTCRNHSPCASPVGMENGAAAVGHSTGAPRKIIHRITI